MKNLYFLFIMTLAITKFSACSNNDSTTVIVKEYESCCGLEPVTYSYGEMKVYFPNVFTPNGDGVNDYFHPILNDKVIQSLQFVITDSSNITYFDREFFDPKDLKNYAWDGKDKSGKPFKGSFNYHLLIFDSNGKEYEIKGKACSIVCGPDASVFKTKEGCYYSTQATKDGTLDKTLSNKESDCFK